MTAALAELHSVDVIHADIKPDNILLSGHSPPLVRLADFGLSKRRPDMIGLSISCSMLHATSHFRGTSLYAAPEMLKYHLLEDIDSDDEDANRCACPFLKASLND